MAINFLNTVAVDENVLFVDAVNDRVGIGTDSPDVRLEVVEASPTNGIVADFVNSTNAGGTTAAIKLSNADSEACDVVLGANRVGANFGSDFFISLSDGVDGSNQERFRITEAGNVGIGTTSPQEKLHVYNTGAARIEIEGTNDSTAFKATNNAGSYAWYVPGENNSFRLFNFGTGSDLVTVNASGNVGIGTPSPSEKLEVYGNIKIQSALLSNQNNTDVDTGTEAIASVALATYTAAFFDFVIKKGTNVRSGTVYACHDGTNVEFTETSTNDLGDTSDVTLNVVISTIYLQLQATTTSDDWSVKSLIRAI